MLDHKKEPEKEENLERWLLTYSDLITLLLLFFIVMYAMSNINKAKFEELAESLIFGFKSGYTLFKMENSNTNNLNEEGIKKGEEKETGSVKNKTRPIFLSRTYQEALFMFHEEIKSKKIRVDINERGIIISLSSDIYFKKASAELDIDAARGVLEKIANLLLTENIKDKNVRIEGFTDSTLPDPDGPWSTNWQLGASRAINVLSYLVDFGADQKKFSIASYADNQPIAPETSEENRSLNRRVDIVILRD